MTGVRHAPDSSWVGMGDLRGALFVWRRWLGLVVLALYLTGACLIQLWPRQYVATMIVAPAETAAIATSQILTAGPLFGGGLLDQRPGGNFAVYLAVLRSADAAAMLMQHDIARDMQQRGGWLRGLLDGGGALSRDDMQRFLERALAITSARQTVTWTLELAHPDRRVALSTLQHLHDFAEALVRAGLRDTVARRVQILQTQIAAETDLFQRQVLYELLAQQQRFALVLAADEAVAARVVSAASVEEAPSRPNRALLLMLWAPGAALLTLAGAALTAARRRQARARHSQVHAHV